MGGVFNPVHMAHLIAAEEVRGQLQLDKVLFIPSANPPHKNAADIAPAEQRLDMVSLAVKGNKFFEVSDIEILRSGKSYTVDTLIALNEKYNDAKFYLIIGIDQLIEFHAWKGPETILTLAEIIAINRPGYSETEIKNDYRKKVTHLQIPDIEISGSSIRQRIKENKSIKYLVPEAVERYITENNLYK
jgi:nicotinate-nucleotide adenylyltransferase